MATDKQREEIRAELLREQGAKRDQEWINRHTFARVMNDFGDEFAKFDWKQERIITRSWNDTSYLSTDNHPEAYKVRCAIGTLARAAFHERTTGRIPSSKEDQLRQITKGILGIVLNEIA